MPKILKKIKLKLIFIESLAAYFLVNGSQRIYVASQADQYELLALGKWEELESLISGSISEIIVTKAYWTFGIFIICIVTIGVLNWKNKISIINIILVSLIVFSFFPLGFFSTGLIFKYLNYLGGIFADDYGLSFFIGGCILSIIGITLLWLIFKQHNKRTVHNNV